MTKSVSVQIKEALAELEVLKASDRVLRVAQMAVAEGHDMIEDVKCAPEQFNAWYDLEARRESIHNEVMDIYFHLERLGWDHKVAA